MRRKRGAQIQGCGHGFCADCMTSYLTIKIKERSIAAPPDPIAPSEIGHEFDILQPPRPYDTTRHDIRHTLADNACSMLLGVLVRAGRQPRR